MLPPLFIHADSTGGVLGHVMRCSGVREAWERKSGDFSPSSLRYPAISILDGYRYTNYDRRSLRQDGLVVSFSDFAEELDTDVLLNYNLGASRLEYTGDIGLKLLEPIYFPLTSYAKSVTVPKMSGDVFDTTALDRILAYTEFIDQMAKASRVICPASVKLYEALYLNKNITLVPPRADNQKAVYDAFTHAPQWLEGCGRKLVDGKGAARIVDALLWAYGVKFPDVPLSLPNHR